MNNHSLKQFLHPLWRDADSIDNNSETDTNKIVLNAIDNQLKKAETRTVKAKSQMYLNSASDEFLDYWGSWFGLKRKDNQNDDSYRESIFNHITHERNTIPSLKKQISEFLATNISNVEIYEPWNDIFLTNDPDSLTNNKAHLYGDYYRPAIIDIHIGAQFDSTLLDIINWFRPAGVIFQLTYDSGLDPNAPIVSMSPNELEYLNRLLTTSHYIGFSTSKRWYLTPALDNQMSLSSKFSLNKSLLNGNDYLDDYSYSKNKKYTYIGTSTNRISPESEMSFNTDYSLNLIDSSEYHKLEWADESYLKVKHPDTPNFFIYTFMDFRSFFYNSVQSFGEVYSYLGVNANNEEINKYTSDYFNRINLLTNVKIALQKVDFTISLYNFNLGIFVTFDKSFTNSLNTLKSLNDISPYLSKEGILCLEIGVNNNNLNQDVLLDEIQFDFDKTYTYRNSINVYADRKDSDKMNSLIHYSKINNINNYKNLEYHYNKHTPIKYIRNYIRDVRYGAIVSPEESFKLNKSRINGINNIADSTQTLVYDTKQSFVPSVVTPSYVDNKPVSSISFLGGYSNSGKPYNILGNLLKGTVNDQYMYPIYELSNKDNKEVSRSGDEYTIKDLSEESSVIFTSESLKNGRNYQIGFKVKGSGDISINYTLYSNEYSQTEKDVIKLSNEYTEYTIPFNTKKVFPDLFTLEITSTTGTTQVSIKELSVNEPYTLTVDQKESSQKAPQIVAQDDKLHYQDIQFGEAMSNINQALLWNDLAQNHTLWSTLSILHINYYYIINHKLFTELTYRKLESLNKLWSQLDKEGTTFNLSNNNTEHSEEHCVTLELDNEHTDISDVLVHHGSDSLENTEYESCVQISSNGTDWITLYDNYKNKKDDFYIEPSSAPKMINVPSYDVFKRNYSNDYVDSTNSRIPSSLKKSNIFYNMDSLYLEGSHTGYAGLHYEGFLKGVGAIDQQIASSDVVYKNSDMLTSDYSENSDQITNQLILQYNLEAYVKNNYPDIYTQIIQEDNFDMDSFLQNLVTNDNPIIIDLHPAIRQEDSYTYDKAKNLTWDELASKNIKYVDSDSKGNQAKISVNPYTYELAQNESIKWKNSLDSLVTYQDTINMSQNEVHNYTNFPCYVSIWNSLKSTWVSQEIVNGKLILTDISLFLNNKSIYITLFINRGSIELISDNFELSSAQPTVPTTIDKSFPHINYAYSTNSSLKFVGNGEQQIIKLYNINKKVIGKKITISFNVTTDNLGGTFNLNILDYTFSDIAIKKGNQHFSFTLELSKDSIVDNDYITPELILNRSYSNFILYNFKAELGSDETPYTTTLPT